MMIPVLKFLCGMVCSVSTAMLLLYTAGTPEAGTVCGFLTIVIGAILTRTWVEG